MSSTDSPAEGVGSAVEAPAAVPASPSNKAQPPVPDRVPTTGARAVARTGLLSMVALVVLGLTRLVYNSLVSRVTDKETYGLVAALLAVTMIVSLLLPAGVAAATSRFVPFSRGAGDLAAARGLYRALDRLGLGGAVLLSVAAALVTRSVAGLGAWTAVEVGLLTFAYSAYSVDKSALYAFGRVGRYVRLEIVSSGVTLLAAVVLVVSGGTWYLTPLVVGYTVFVVGARLSLRADLRGDATRASKGDWGAIAGYAALACVGTLSSAGFLQATQLLAVNVAGTAQAAYFGAAVALITPLYFLPRALALALFPALAEAHGAGDTATVRKHADVGSRTLVAVLAPLFVAALFLAPEALFLFGGDRYRDGAPVLQLMLAATYLAVIQVPSVNALSSGSGWQLRTPVLSALSGCLVGLAVVVTIGHRFGATGVAVAYLVGTAVTAAGPILAVWRRYGLTWGGPLTRAILAVAAALAGAWALAGAGLPTGTKWMIDVGAAVVAAAIATVVVGTDLRGVWRSVRRRRSGRSGGTAEPAVDAAGKDDGNAPHSCLPCVTSCRYLHIRPIYYSSTNY
jgi:O-antigen/teichoic acid export membrane protein